MLNRYNWIIIVFICTLSLRMTYAQPDTLWTKTFGGSSQDWGTCVQQTSDEGYIIVGGASSFGAGESDVWLIKTGALGDTLWTKTFGGSSQDWGTCVQQTSDKGYIVVGGASSFGEDVNNVWLIKTDISGDTLWTKTFGRSSYDVGNYVQQTSDGGYIILSSPSGMRPSGDESAVLLIKTDALGDTLWTKTFLVSYDCMGSSVQQTSDGGYIMTGVTSESSSPGNMFTDSDIWLIKTDTSGNTLWEKTYGGEHHDEGGSVQQTSDGGYIIIGSKHKTDYLAYNVWLIKTDALGDTLWTKTYGGEEENDAFGASVQQTSDGGYIITGTTNSYDSRSADVWLIKTDSFGDTLWTMTYGGSGSEEGMSVQQTSDSGYIIAGNKFSFPREDIWLIRVAPDTVQVAAEDSPKLHPSSFYFHQNHPNPFNPVTTIRYDLPEQSHVSILIYDILGREIRKLINTTQDAGYKSVIWDGTDEFGRSVGTGIYLYQIKAGDFTQTRKMLLLR